MKNKTLVKYFIHGLACLSFLFGNKLLGCTIGVASARVTGDHRPLLWKNQDAQIQDIQAAFFVGRVGDFIGIITQNDTSRVWAGVNSVGFAIVNAEALDLEGDRVGAEGNFIKMALTECSNIDRFETLLKLTNLASGRATRANFGVMDALGNAAIFEVGNHSYVKFDANDPDVAPLGFIVRSNFGITGKGEGQGANRYHRACSLFETAIDRQNLTYRYLIRTLARDLVSQAINPYPLPFRGQYEDYPEGYINTENCINRYQTVSCAVVHGVMENENPRLTTLWLIPGEPVFGIAIPLWVHAGPVPPTMNGENGSKMNQGLARQKRRGYPLNQRPELLNTFVLAGSRFSVWPSYLEEEENIFTASEKMLQNWRSGTVSHEAMRQFEYKVIARAYRMLR